MIDSVPGLGACKRIVSTLALAVLAVTLAGCGSGSGGGPGANPANFGVLQPDRHGNNAASSTRIYPDNGSITEAINFPGDEDWFKYQAVEGVIYVLQVQGYDVQFPDLTESTNNNTFSFDLQQSFFIPDGSTQTQTTSGNLGGTPFDINVAGIDEGNIVGDSRILWIAPTTGTYYVRLLHRRHPTGIGNYHINVASSQFGITQDLEIPRSHWRAVIVPGEEENDPPFFVNEYIQMFTPPFAWDINDQEFFFGNPAILQRFVRLIEEGEDEGTYVFSDVEETLAMHLHVGFPNILDGGDSSDITDGTGHAVALDFGTVNARGGDAAIREAILRREDGSQLRLPATKLDQDERRNGLEYKINLGHALTRQVEDFSLEVVRLLIGWPVFADVHYTTAFDLEELSPYNTPGLPVSVSGHLLDAYSIFETPLLATPANLTREQLENVPEKYLRKWDPNTEYADRFESTYRALGVQRQYTASGVIRYDAALQAFSIVDRQYDPGIRPPNLPFPVISAPITSFPALQPQAPPLVFTDEIPADFIGLRIDVHRGAPGINGPLLMALGTIPEPKLPPGINAVAGNIPVQTIISASPGVAFYDEGFENRTIIRKLTNAEAATLRRAFYYEGGFNIQIKDQKIPGSPTIARAEGFIGLQFFPNDPPPLQARSDGTVVDNHGTVRFATTYAGGAVTVIANGEILGDLTSPVDGEAPECGNDPPGSVVSARLLPDEYYYRAFAEDGTEWDGIFTIDGMGSCNTILLAPN